MNKLWNKIKSVYYLLGSDGYVLIYENRFKNSEPEAGFYLSGLDAKEIVLYCDSLSDELEHDMEEEENAMVSEKLGKAMVNFTNQIHLN